MKGLSLVKRKIALSVPFNQVITLHLKVEFQSQEVRPTVRF